MSDGDFEIVKAIPKPEIRRLVRVRDVDFDEAFVAGLISDYFNRKNLDAEPRLSDAMEVKWGSNLAQQILAGRGSLAKLAVFSRPTVGW